MGLNWRYTLMILYYVHRLHFAFYWFFSQRELDHFLQFLRWLWLNIYSGNNISDWNTWWNFFGWWSYQLALNSWQWGQTILRSGSWLLKDRQSFRNCLLVFVNFIWRITISYICCPLRDYRSIRWLIFFECRGPTQILRIQHHNLMLFNLRF